MPKAESCFQLAKCIRDRNLFVLFDIRDKQRCLVRISTRAQLLGLGVLTSFLDVQDVV